MAANALLTSMEFMRGDVLAATARQPPAGPCAPRRVASHITEVSGAATRAAACRHARNGRLVGRSRLVGTIGRIGSTALSWWYASALRACPGATLCRRVGTAGAEAPFPALLPRVRHGPARLIRSGHWKRGSPAMVVRKAGFCYCSSPSHFRAQDLDREKPIMSALCRSGVSMHAAAVATHRGLSR